MEEFRDELKKYVDESQDLQSENSQLSGEVFNLKQRLVEQEHRHSEMLEQVRSQYVTEMEHAKDSWREQAVKYGQQQRIVGREESVSSSYSDCNKTIEYGMRVNSSAAGNDAVICNALIASARFTVALIDFDVSDHHISIVNTTDININLNGCYIVLEKSGDRFDVCEDIVLEPKTKCSVWWASHNADSERTEHISQNTHLCRHCVPALSLFWHRTGHNPDHPEHNRTSVSIAEVAQLFDSAHRKICQAVTNQAMFSVYYDYQIKDMSAHFAVDVANRRRESAAGLNSSTLSEHNGRTQSKTKTARGVLSPMTAENQPTHPAALFPHVHYTRQNTCDCIRFVEESDVLLMDYASDLLARLDRFAKRSTGCVRLCGFPETPGSASGGGGKHTSRASGAGTSCFPPKNSAGAAAPAQQYSVSMCHAPARVIDVEAILAHDCLTIENLSVTGAGAPPPLDLNPKCTVRLICSSDASGGAQFTTSLSFQLERRVVLAAGQRVVLVGNAPAHHASHVIPVVGCAELLARLRSLSAGMHAHCTTSAKRSRNRNRAAMALLNTAEVDADSDVDSRSHNVQLGFLTLCDQHDNLLFCVSVVQAVDISKTVFTANVSALQGVAQSMGAGADGRASGVGNKRKRSEEEEDCEDSECEHRHQRNRDDPHGLSRKAIHPTVLGRVSSFVSKIFG